MRKFFLVLAAILFGGFLAVSQSQAGVHVFVGLPGPVYYGPGYYGPDYYYGPNYYYGPGYYPAGYYWGLTGMPIIATPIGTTGIGDITAGTGIKTGGEPLAAPTAAHAESFSARSTRSSATISHSS